jgi:hypothetical protein
MTRNTHELDYDHRGAFGSNARFSVLASDPAAVAASTLGLYAKTTGLFVIDSSGGITGPLGTGGGGGGSGAYGSNANDVGNPSTGGANSSNSRADHVHLGVRQITSNTSNTLTQPNINLVAGTGIAFDASVASQLTIRNIGTSSGGGGGSGTTIQYPTLKPATPTDDFNSASLSGSWSAHSNGGSFGTGNCLTQGIDWMGSSLEMQFSAQMGTLYRTHADADLDFTVGGMRAILGPEGVRMMFGIAALDTSGNGVGVVVYDDGSAYFAAITAYSYVSNSDSVGFGMTGSGAGTRQHNGIWVRLKRISGTWTGYVSLSGRAWDKTFSTRADSVTVAQLHVGLLYDAAVTYSGRLTADYFDLTT